MSKVIEIFTKIRNEHWAHWSSSELEDVNQAITCLKSFILLGPTLPGEEYPGELHALRQHLAAYGLLRL